MSLPVGVFTITETTIEGGSGVARGLRARSELAQGRGSVVLETGKHRMRLILVDLPEGLSAPMMAIAIVAPAARFEQAAKAAEPVLDSVEFHTA